VSTIPQPATSPLRPRLSYAHASTRPPHRYAELVAKHLAGAATQHSDASTAHAQQLLSSLSPVFNRLWSSEAFARVFALLMHRFLLCRHHTPPAASRPAHELVDGAAVAHSAARRPLPPTAGAQEADVELPAADATPSSSLISRSVSAGFSVGPAGGGECSGVAATVGAASPPLRSAAVDDPSALHDGEGRVANGAHGTGVLSAASVASAQWDAYQRSRNVANEFTVLLQGLQVGRARYQCQGDMPQHSSPPICPSCRLCCGKT